MAFFYFLLTLHAFLSILESKTAAVQDLSKVGILFRESSFSCVCWRNRALMISLPMCHFPCTWITSLVPEIFGLFHKSLNA